VCSCPPNYGTAQKVTGQYKSLGSSHVELGSLNPWDIPVSSITETVGEGTCACAQCTCSCKINLTILQHQLHDMCQHNRELSSSF
jgi:hypothetical protein